MTLQEMFARRAMWIKTLRAYEAELKVWTLPRQKEKYTELIAQTVTLLNNLDSEIVKMGGNRVYH